MKPEDVTEEMCRVAWEAYNAKPTECMPHIISAAINASPLYSAALQMLDVLQWIRADFCNSEFMTNEEQNKVRAAIAAATGEKE